MHCVVCFLLLLVTCLPAATATWTGGGGDDLWGTGANWQGGSAPANDGTADIVFDGDTRLTPSLDANWSVNSVTFAATAGAFTLGGASTLTIGAGGVTNNDTDSTQTIACPISGGANQSWTVNAVASVLMVTGSMSGTFTLTKTGIGVLDLASSATTVNTITWKPARGILRDSSASGLLSGAITFSGAPGDSAPAVIEVAGGNFAGRSLGTTAGTLGWATAGDGSGGFAARGAARTAAVAGMTWNTSINGLKTGQEFCLGSATSNNTVTYTNNINFGGGTRTVRVIRGTGSGPDAILSGLLSVGSLTLAGNGILGLTNASDSFVNVVINAGTTLLVSNTVTASGTTTVHGTLGGTSTLTSVVSLAAGGALAPGASGNSIGTLTIAKAVSASGSATLQIDLNPTSSSSCDQLVLSGSGTDGDISLANIALAISGTAGSGSYPLITCTNGGTLTGTFASTSGIPNGGSISYTGTSATLVIPSTTYTWNGGGGNDNWSTGANWDGGNAPSNDGSADIVFDGGTRLTPSLDANCSVRSLTFASGAGAFTLGGSSTLTISGTAGITNNDTDSTQTIACPVAPYSATNGMTWTVNAIGSPLLFSGTLSGTYTLTKGGIGVMEIASGATFPNTITWSPARGILRESVAGLLTGLVYFTGAPGDSAPAVVELAGGNWSKTYGSTGPNRTGFAASGNGSGGFAARGAARTATVATTTWNSTNFALKNGQELCLGSATSDNTVTWASALNLNAGTRTVRVIEGTGSGADAAISGAISNGSLTLSGNGSLNLTTAAHSLTNLVIDAGCTLLASTTVSASGGTTLNGTLGGTSTLTSAVTLAAGGTLAPGGLNNGIGTLTVNGAVSGTGGTLAFDLSASSNDRLNLSSAGTALTRTNLTLALSGTPTGTVTLISCTGGGTMSGTFAAITGIPTGYTVQQNASDVTLVPPTISITWGDDTTANKSWAIPDMLAGTSASRNDLSVKADPTNVVPVTLTATCTASSWAVAATASSDTCAMRSGATGLGTTAQTLVSGLTAGASHALPLTFTAPTSGTLGSQSITVTITASP